MNKAVDAYRQAVITATCDEIISGLEQLATITAKRKGSWMSRSLGVKDAIQLVKSYKNVMEKAAE